MIRTVGLLCLVVFAGCSSNDAVPIAGKVTLSSGEAVAHGSVTFNPDKSRGNNYDKFPSGKINADGTYRLQAPPGFYKATVTTNAPTDPNPKGPKLKSIYTTAAESTLNIEVESTPAPGAFDLKVEVK